MNDLKIFENEKFGKIRTTLTGSDPWFVLRDVCDALGVAQTRDVANRLDEDEKGLTMVTDSSGRRQKMIIVNESGLYNVVLRSDKPEAKEFKRWVTHDVLPTLRKTGAYQIAPTYEKPTMAIVREMELRAKTMEKMGCSAFEIAGMMTSMDKAYNIPVPAVFANKVDPQMCLFSGDAPMLTA